MSDEPKAPRERVIYTRFITRKGKRIYRRDGGLFRFTVKER